MTLNEIKKLFKKEALFKTAITHSSMASKSNNERLEFLGDRVLGLAMADILYKRYPSEKEGDLAKRHSALVCTEALGQVAREIKMDETLEVIDTEMRRQTHVLANAMEALLGALYMDQGFDAAHNLIEKLWDELIDTFTTPPQDAKSTLQEVVQKQGEPLPQYEIIGREGEEHAPIFEVKVTTMGQSATGKGPSRKGAEQSAAEEMLKKLK